MLNSLLIVVHVFVALVLIVVVLLQSGKGAGLGAGFGGTSQSLFGARGPASFLSKFTTGAAIVFMVTSLTLSVLSTGLGKSSVADKIREPKAPAAPAPLAPAAPAAPGQQSGNIDPYNVVHEAGQQTSSAAPEQKGPSTQAK